IVAGVTTSSDLPVYNAWQGRMVSGSGHGLLAKFDSSGQRVMATYFIGVAGARTGFRAVGCDSAGNIIAAGGTEDRELPVVNAYQASYDLNTDVFFLKLSPANQILFCSYFGGYGEEVVYGIAVDKRGNFAMTGKTFSPNFPRVS